MPNLNDGDWSLTVSEFPLIAPDGSVTWESGYWEVRNSAMGEWIAQAIRVSAVSPWEDDIGRGGDEQDWQVMDAEYLRNKGVPDVIINRMYERGIFTKD